VRNEPKRASGHQASALYQAFGAGWLSECPCDGSD
jgi:hypothetical protein